MSTMRVDFFRVSVQDDTTFASILKTVGELPNDDGRNFQFKNGPVRLAQCHHSSHIIEGDMMRIRLNEAAVIAGLNGDLKPVSIDDEHGLGETSAFLFDPQLGVIAYQRNRTGVNAYNAAYYFQQKAGLENPIEFELIMKPDVIRRLHEMKQIRKYRVRIARVNNIKNVDDDVPSVSAGINQARQFESPSIEFKVSMARQHGGLNLKEVLRSAKQLLKKHTEDSEAVTAIEVTGKDDDDSRSELIDLIKERLCVTMDIEPSPLHDEFYRRRRDVIREAWDRNRQTLRQICRE